MGQWALALDIPAPAAHPSPAHESLPPPPPASKPMPVPKQRMALQELARDAPPEFRCLLDGRLLMDPVRSPEGHVFERAGLAGALRDSGGLCPISRVPLLLDCCE